MYSCKETCGQRKPCGNRHCSANPKYVPPSPKKRSNAKVPGEKQIPAGIAALMSR